MQSTHNCDGCWRCEHWPRWFCDKCSTHNTHVCGECRDCLIDKYCDRCSTHNTHDCGKCDKCQMDKRCYPCVNYHQQFYKAEWSSGDEEIDSLINECNKITMSYTFTQFFEWIPFERFKNVEYLARGGFATIYKAEWLDGPFELPLAWNHKENKFPRDERKEVVLKTLNNTKQITLEFRNEVKDKTFECGLLFF